MQKQIYLVSLGCNKNLVDSEILLGKLKDYKITNEPEDADLLVINTCGFIESAKTESIDTILELAETKKENAKILVCGCLSARYKEELVKALPEVDIFTGNADYEDIKELVEKNENKFTPGSYLQNKNDERIITGSSFHAYIKIAEGCNQRCSFCSIPTFRGKLQSRQIDDIVAEIENLIQKGYNDFSFIAQDTSSYGRDLGLKNGLLNLIEKVEKIKGIKAARILYLYPTNLNEEVIKKIISSEVFLNYFDMPIQHINDDLLKIMKRGTKKETMLKQLNLMRNAPESFIRTGIIIGHPGESDEAFNELLEFLKSFDFDRISAFAYSKEEDTASFDMEEIPDQIIEKRLEIIEKITDKMIDKSLNSLIGREIKVQINGISSEGELFWGAKDLRWDRDIDGEILINDSEINNPQTGEIYYCKINEIIAGKPLGTITRKYESSK